MPALGWLLFRTLPEPVALKSVTSAEQGEEGGGVDDGARDVGGVGADEAEAQRSTAEGDGR